MRVSLEAIHLNFLTRF